MNDLRSLQGFFNKRISLCSFFIFFAFFLGSCSTKYLKYDQEEKLKTNEEFEEVVKIQEVPVEESVPATAAIPVPVEALQKDKSAKSKKDSALKTSQKVPVASQAKKKSKGSQTAEEKAAPPVRQPELEDSLGFAGRRPLVDPFRVGEKMVHDVHYFRVSAGRLTMSLSPFVQVNGRKSYSFLFDIETVGLFSQFYSVQDRATVLVDYEEMIPRVYTLNVKETGQLREARSFFDFDKGVATFWEKKYTEKNGHEERKESWEIQPYSQNVFSAIHYMRTFQWDVGKEISFRVADDKQNLVFKGKCLRREVIKTKVGQFTALVIKPEFTLQGKFKPVGENLIWISDDDRKYILRIESSIKIGTLVSEIVALEPGG